MTRRLATLFVAMVATGHTVTATAQQPMVVLRLPSRTLEVGEAINFQVQCINTGEPDAPQAAVPDGLQLTLVNPTPSTSSQISILNGRRTQRVEYTYTMRLVALEEGTFTLGPIVIQADGTSYQTDPAVITVRKTDISSTPKGDRFIFVDLSVSRESLYLSEPYEAVMTIGIRKVEIRGQVIELDMLRQVLDLGASQLSVFAGSNVQRSERWLPDASGARHRYEVFEVRKSLTADEAGTTTIGPVFLAANYPTGVRSGFFGRMEISQHRRESARADAVRLEVKAPPTEGRPALYNGAIGRYAMRVDAKPTRVEQGQPITLTVVINGAPLENMPGPDLASQADLASRFDFTTEEMVGDVEGSAKVFHRAIFPKQVGEQTVPPLRWAYFDPREERYVSVSSDPVVIIVDPPTNVPSASLSLIEQPAPTDQTTDLTVLTGGISPNALDARVVLATRDASLSRPWLVTLAVAPMAWLVITLTSRRRTRLRTDVNFARRKRARRRAHAAIHRSLGRSETVERLHGIAAALTAYLSDRFVLNSATLTPEEVRSTLTDSGLSESTASEIAAFLDACDTARYAPGAMGSTSPDEAASQAREWIKRIEGGKA